MSCGLAAPFLYKVTHFLTPAEWGSSLSARLRDLGVFFRFCSAILFICPLLSAAATREFSVFTLDSKLCRVVKMFS